MNETGYRKKLMDKIMDMFPGCFILKTDAKHVQGLPDLIVLYKNTWAALEIKISPKAKVQPNQQHYVDTLDSMSFASFINPDNEGEVLNELQRSFGITRKARLSKSK